MTTTITSSLGGSTTPLILTKATIGRETLNTTQRLLTGVVAVNLRGSAERSGTLTLVYATDATANSAETLLKAAATFTIVETDRTVYNMTFVVDGTIERELDDETREAWILTVPYRQVA